MSSEARDRPSRVVLLALDSRVRGGVLDYVGHLVSTGVRVDVVVVDRASKRAVRTDPRANPWLAPSRPRVHALVASEHALLARRIERFVVYRIPGAIVARAADRFADGQAGPALARTVRWVQRHQPPLSRAVHGRLFLPAYRQLRPWLLGRRLRTVRQRIDLAGAQRIVAADLNATTLAWRLARRYPHAVATTALDRLTEETV